MYHPHLFLRRGPSRIFWFIIGAGAATWWHHASFVRDHRAQYFPCLTQYRRVQDPTTSSQEPALRTEARSPTGQSQQRDWEQDRERLKHLQKRAGETITDLSESTLDSIISGAESLKAKLSQLRTEREQLETEKKTTHSAV